MIHCEAGFRRMFAHVGVRWIWTRTRFERRRGVNVPAVTAGEMRDVGHVAIEEYGLSLLQMVEHAGRRLAARYWTAPKMGRSSSSPARAVTMAVALHAMR